MLPTTIILSRKRYNLADSEPSNWGGDPMSTEDTASASRKDYFPPKVVHTEKIETRAVACSKGDEAHCGSGPIQS